VKRIIIKIGDLFSVEIDEKQVKFFQYIANDLTQLNSSVIRAFKKIYQKDEIPDWDEVVKGEVEFFTHTILRVGIKLEHWKKVGKSSEVGICDMFFRSSSDIGNPKITTSENWYIWKINQPKIRVGKLEGEYRKAELGTVFPSKEVIARIRTGEPYKEYLGF
jgi:hypothetical protein